jgi:hypothetical protein
MAAKRVGGVNRREFLKGAGVAAGAMAAGLAGGCSVVEGDGGAGGAKRVVIAVVDAPAVASPEVRWAVGRLTDALAAKGVHVTRAAGASALAGDAWTVVVAAAEGAVAAAVLKNGRIVVPAVAEATALVPLAGGQGVLATGHDARGVMYALLELADRVEQATGDVVAAMRVETAVVERPANRVRGIFRMFASEVEDKSWFYDREFWRRYLTMLAGQRFNRFNLSLGLSYDFSRNLTDTYFFFAYPFLVEVPGYDVRAVRPGDKQALSTAERAKNLETLRFVSDEAAARGIDFMLGIWTHSFRWTNSPNATYVIEGLTAETQGAYSRAALHQVLEACPNIRGVTLRTHGESGVPEGNFEIWKTIFGGVTGLTDGRGRPRTVEIDLHGKGMTPQMIETALTSGMPVTVSPKFWAEHLGLPYMQSSIRELEMPRERDAGGLMSLSSGTRSFLRYSYGDLFAADRKHRVVTRIWPGTQRLLLWGDPLYAAELGKCFTFCGGDGMDFFEPLSFKGRAGSGQSEAAAGGQRGGYAAADLRPAQDDWEKYLYTYRLWGRLSYNPECDAGVWRRALRGTFGAAAGAVEAGLAQASRILPLITSAHDPSGANHDYWPEMYVNMSIVDPTRPGSYADTPTPKVFTTVSPLDPQLFATVRETADVLLGGGGVAGMRKVSVLEVAEQLDRWAEGAEREFARAGKASGAGSAAFRRAEIDTTIVAGLGRFFARKLRAAVLWEVFDRTGVMRAREEAVALYRQARDAWAGLAARAEGVYVSDLSYGDAGQLRGHWSDRLAGIERDIAAMAARAASGSAVGLPDAVERAMAAVAARQAPRPPARVGHVPAAAFSPGAALPLAVEATARAVRLWYRHVHQGERWVSVPMTAGPRGAFAVEIPADYTRGVLPLQYYFEVEAADGAVGMYPGFGADFVGQPYVVVQGR